MSTNDTTTDDELTSPVEGHADGASVAELEDALDENDYDEDELLAALEYERAKEDPRSTAIEAIDEAYDEATAGPDIGEAPVEDPSPDGNITAMDADLEDAEDGVIDHRSQGAGATEAGLAGVVLPNPYDDGAPQSVLVLVPERMHFAGTFYDDADEHRVEYDMRVKTALETETNPVALSENDPLHPAHDEESGPAGQLV